MLVYLVGNPKKELKLDNHATLNTVSPVTIKAGYKTVDTFARKTAQDRVEDAQDECLDELVLLSSTSLSNFLSNTPALAQS
jgi:hypothetical protein